MKTEQLDRIPQNSTALGSMAEVEASTHVTYLEINGFAPGQTLIIGSLTANDMLEWNEANEEDKIAKRVAGLRLICKSLVDSKGVRFAIDEKNVEIFKRKTHKETQNVVKEILILNGMKTREELEGGKKTDVKDAAKNA